MARRRVATWPLNIVAYAWSPIVARSSLDATRSVNMIVVVPATGPVSLVEQWNGDADLVAVVVDAAAERRDSIGDHTTVHRALPDPGAFDAWEARWRSRLAAEGRPAGDVAAAIDRTNPAYIPRNHLVEDALAAATSGDLAPFEQLVEVVTQPFETRPDWRAYSEPAPPDSGHYRTFCGT